MRNGIELEILDRRGMLWASELCCTLHYLRTPVDQRTMPMGYMARIAGRPAGLLLFGRPEATRCRDWYGGVGDVRSGRCEVTRWQVLNLSRVLLLPEYQMGGEFCQPEILPGFVDRAGAWRSTLASTAIRLATMRIGFDYLMARPPVFVDEPFEIAWLMSYCDRRLHKGTIYQASGFERFETGNPWIQTWRIRLPGLTGRQSAAVVNRSAVDPRAIRIRASRAQLKLF